MQGHPTSVWEASSLENGLQEDHSHGLNAGVRIKTVSFCVITQPNDGSAVFMDWDEADDDTTNGTVRLRFRSAGSLEGAKVKITATSGDVASGGVTLSSPL
jgi:hypothetical protein